MDKAFAWMRLYWYGEKEVIGAYYCEHQFYGKENNYIDVYVEVGLN